MYSTCIHCHGALGSNEAIEAFPVGRRLAFDPTKGRLWVVCPKCRRWNLTPIEERWEAIEQCERLFRGTRLRASTDNIGLAKVADATELIRIGAPQRPELAAWRYTADLRRRWLVYGAPLTLAGGLMSTVGMAGAIGFATQMALVGTLGGGMFAYKWLGQRVRTILPDGRVITLNGLRSRQIRLTATDSGWGISGYEIGDSISGPRAAYTFRSVLTSRNFRGGQAEDIDNAVSLLAEIPDPDRFISRVARVAERHHADPLPTHISFALEMALHEDVERRALEGELADLERQWSIADEIATIADNMMIPSHVIDGVASLKSRR